MPTHPTELAEILNHVNRPGKFYAAGAAEIYLPSLEVEGVGPIAFPLLSFQAEQLVAVAKRAPYGRGEETLVDTQVRRTWQIGAEKLNIHGKYWLQNLQEITDWVKTKLGVVGPINAELYKLLVYDTGSFFVSHRDTEKAPGMFATLVIVLPSLYEGGALLVRHQEEEARLELNIAGPSELAFAAFYADCLHEVLPVTKGCRLTLIYNLLRTEKTKVTEPPRYRSEQERLADWLRQWAEETLDEGDPVKLIYPLEHVYTQAELSFSALKGADTAKAAVAVAAARQADCEVFLALLSVEETGYAEYSGDYGGYDDYGNDEELEVGEVTDSEQYLSEWRNPDDSLAALDQIPFENQELCIPNAFEGLEPDELYFEEATGNAGASFERTYRRAALVFWPRARRFAVLDQGSLSNALLYLGDLAERWMVSGEDTASPLWQEAHGLAEYLIETRQETFAYRPPYSTDKTSAAAELLEILWHLRDGVCIDNFLVNISATGGYGIEDNIPLVQAISLLSLPRATELIQQIIAANTTQYPSACADLLARCASASWLSGYRALLLPAAQSLVDLLPGNSSTPPSTESWQSTPKIEAFFVVELMGALELISPVLAEQAADCLLLRPATYGFDSVLIPALLLLSMQSGTATTKLRQACLQHLAGRIAEPLEPPRDWTRSSAIGCTCEHCVDLSRFLADPKEKEWTLRAAQHLRSHVEDSIRRAVCDLSTRTVTRGRPYTLVCMKNQASYFRRIDQRERDLENQAALQKAS